MDNLTTLYTVALPDETARVGMITRHIQAAPAPLNTANVQRLADATAQFSGADLKRTTEDAKALYAFDRVGGSVKPVSEYFVHAAEVVRASKVKYAEAEARANAARPARPVWFNPFSASEAAGDAS
ncbi:MAG TPA: hypothetical protein VHV08_04425 [Pirellulales bacterium]|jgi:SpoVK/Ycf46/Vps4 family AAA+-type ATPase|nr:hypothetical protein [Pirellulales bacterium]